MIELLCIKCRAKKAPTEFHRRRASKTGRHSICKVCRIPIVTPGIRAWQANNRERVREINRASYRKHRERILWSRKLKACGVVESQQVGGES